MLRVEAEEKIKQAGYRTEFVDADRLVVYTRAGEYVVAFVVERDDTIRREGIMNFLEQNG